MTRRTVLFVAGVVLAGACRRDPDPSTTPSPSSTSAAPAATSPASESDRVEPVGFEMRGVQLRAAPDIILHVEHLRGRLISRRAETGGR